MPSRSASSVDELRPFERRGVDRDLVGACREQLLCVGDRAHTAADGERDRQPLGHTARTSSTSVCRPSSVALTSRKTSSSAPASEYAAAELDRIADVAQPLKAHALDDAAGRHVEARDQTRERHDTSSSQIARAGRAALLRVKLAADERPGARPRRRCPPTTRSRMAVSAAYECAK